MDEGLVSVVIPIYNMEEYLDRCVSSVINQTYQRLQIILVDDGSSDASSDMCDLWQATDERITVVHKKNEGLGKARNTGIEKADGEFICFIDSDDYIDPETISECVRIGRKECADLVCFGNDMVHQNGKVLSSRIPTPPKDVYEGNEIISTLAPMAVSYNAETGETWNLSLSACFCMFSMEVIRRHNWRFVSERVIISEDYYSVMNFYQYAHRIAFIDKVFYHYTVNQNSLTHTYRADRYEKVVYFSKAMLELCQQIGCEAVLTQPVVTLFLNFTISVMKQIAASHIRFGKKYQAIKAIVQDDYCQQQLRIAILSGEGFRKKVLFRAMASKNAFVCLLLTALKRK